MAKKAEKAATTVKKPVIEAAGPKPENLSEPKAELISIQKYLQLHAPVLHSYHRAYLGEQFRGIMKTKEEWKEEMLKQIMEGEK